MYSNWLIDELYNGKEMPCVRAYNLAKRTWVGLSKNGEWYIGTFKGKLHNVNNADKLSLYITSQGVKETHRKALMFLKGQMKDTTFDKFVVETIKFR